MATSSTVTDFAEEEVDLELTPMIDMAFLIIIFFMCLPFKTLEGKLQAFLPTDKGINPTPEEPPQEIKVSVHIVARHEQKRPWGPKPKKGQPDRRILVTMPTQVRYRFGDQETGSLKTVAKWIKDAKAAQTGDVQVIGEIKAGHKVPHKFVVAVLNKFAAADMEKVDFFGTRVPGPKLRRMEVLPYPSSNYVGVSSD